MDKNQMKEVNMLLHKIEDKIERIIALIDENNRRMDESEDSLDKERNKGIRK